MSYSYPACLLNKVPAAKCIIIPVASAHSTGPHWQARGCGVDLIHLILLIHRIHLTHLANATHLTHLTHDRSKSAQDRPGTKIDPKMPQQAPGRLTKAQDRAQDRHQRAPEGPSVSLKAVRRGTKMARRGSQIEHRSPSSPRSADDCLKRASNWFQTGPRTGSPVGLRLELRVGFQSLCGNPGQAKAASF